MVHDTLLIFRRALRLSLRNPAWVVIGLTQPILYLVLFGPLLKRVVGAQGFPAGDAWQVFVPGLLVQLALFGSAFVGFGLLAELRNGVIERMRVTPISRLALLTGLVLRDVLVLMVQSTTLVIVALLFGLRAPVSGVVFVLVMVAILGVTFASASYAIALKVKTEDALAPILQTVSVPLLLLSGILLPMQLAPAWLRGVSDANPVKHIVDGTRTAFRGELASGTTVVGFLVAIGMAVLSLALGTRTFARENA